MTPEQYKSFLKELEKDIVELRLTVLNYVNSGVLSLKSSEIRLFTDVTTKIHKSEIITSQEASEFIRIRDKIGDQLQNVESVNNIELIIPLISLKSIITDSNVSSARRDQAFKESKKLLETANIKTNFNSPEQYLAQFTSIEKQLRQNNQRITPRQLSSVSDLSSYNRFEKIRIDNRRFGMNTFREEFANNPGRFNMRDLRRDTLGVGFSALGLGQLDRFLNLSGRTEALVTKGLKAVTSKLTTKEETKDNFEKLKEATENVITEESQKELDALAGLRTEVKDSSKDQTEVLKTVSQNIDEMTHNQRTQIKLAEKSISEITKANDAAAKERTRRRGHEQFNNGSYGAFGDGWISTGLKALGGGAAGAGALKVLSRVPGAAKVGGLLTKLPGVGKLLGLGAGALGLTEASGITNLAKNAVSTGLSSAGLGQLDKAFNVSGKTSSLMGRMPFGKLLSGASKVAGKLAWPITAALAIKSLYDGFDDTKARNLFGDNGTWSKTKSSIASAASGLSLGILSKEAISNNLLGGSYNQFIKDRAAKQGKTYEQVKAELEAQPTAADIANKYSGSINPNKYTSGSAAFIAAQYGSDPKALGITEDLVDSVDNLKKTPRQEADERQDLANRIVLGLLTTGKASNSGMTPYTGKLDVSNLSSGSLRGGFSSMYGDGGYAGGGVAGGYGSSSDGSNSSDTKPTVSKPSPLMSGESLTTNGSLGYGKNPGAQAPENSSNVRLAQSRANMMAELNADPQLKDFATKAMLAEGGSKGLQNNFEQLFNYAQSRGMTINEALNSGFYGPVNRGEAARRSLSDKERSAADTALGKVAGGSNNIEYRTDQGLMTDPGAVRYANTKGLEYFGHLKKDGNNFFYHGENGKKWADSQRAADTDYQSKNGSLSGNPLVSSSLLNPEGKGISSFKAPVISGDNDNIIMANKGAIRNKALSSNLQDVYNYAAQEAGVKIKVTSGGQDGIGEGNRRTGSVRHDHGGAGDIQLLDAKTGRVLDFTNAEDQKRFQKFTQSASRGGATGIGAGTSYMGSNTIHVGFGKEATWGGTSGQSAPKWLQDSFNAGRDESKNFSMEEWKRSQQAVKPNSVDTTRVTKPQDGLPQLPQPGIAQPRTVNPPPPTPVVPNAPAPVLEQQAGLIQKSSESSNNGDRRTSVDDMGLSIFNNMMLG